jgi:hypothetical protein
MVKEKNGTYTSDATARSLYFEIGNITGAYVDDKTVICQPYITQRI